MLTTTTIHFNRSATARREDKPHVFTSPIVREMPRPTPEPAGWTRCW